jgi:hypothetical protein
MMGIIACLLLLVFSLAHSLPALLAFHRGAIPLLNAALAALGTLNVLGGVSLALSEVRLGVVPIIIGVISINLGAIWDGFWLNDAGPDWNRQAIRSGVSVFLIGLVVLYA